jgi:hypothetical protein
MCGEAGAPSLAPDVAASLVGALQQSCLVLCAAFYALSGAAAGATLRKDVKKLAGGVVQPCIGLLRAMVRVTTAGRAAGANSCPRFGFAGTALTTAPHGCRPQN